MNTPSVITKNIYTITDNNIKLNLNSNICVDVSNGSVKNSESVENGIDICTKKIICRRKMQYIASISANIGNLTAGLMYGWTSPALQHVDYTASEKSWITSILMIGGVFGCILTSLVIDQIGRKATIITSTLPYIISWLMIYTCMEQVYLLYIARFIGGIGVGATLCILPIYTGEIVDDTIRGTMSSLLDIFLSLGILVEYCIGAYVSWHTLALISLVPSVLNLLCAPLIPESPYYYLMKKKWNEAERSLQVLKGRKDVQTELTVLNEMMTKEMNEKQGYSKLFTKFANRKAALIMFGLMTFQQFSGITPLISYTEDIFQAVDGKVDPKISTIVVGIAQLIAGMIGGVVADRWGRRVLLLSSSIGAGLCLIGTGFIFYFKEVLQQDVSTIADLSVVNIVIYIMLINGGLSTQCCVFLSEIFSTNIKAVAVSASNIYVLLFESICTKLFEVIKSAANDKYYLSFWIFGLSGIFSFIFIWIVIPETRGKSLEEIQIWLNKNKPVKKNKEDNQNSQTNGQTVNNSVRTLSSNL